MVFLKKKALLGIDMGSYSIKTALLDTNRKKIIKLSEKVILPKRKSIDDMADETRIEVVFKEALKDNIESYAPYDIEISLSAQGEGVICNYIEFPPLEKKKLELAIQSATMKYIPYPISEAIITYIPVPALNKAEENNKAFFFAAINKLYLDKMKTFNDKLGIEAKKIETFLVPLIKGFTANHGKNPHEFYAVVNTGSRFTTVTILRDGFPYFARDFSIGGINFTYSIQMAAQSSWKEAQQLKHNYDFTTKDHSIEAVFLRWLDQIKKSISAFTRLNRKLNLSVSKIILTGGSARAINIDNRLADYLNTPVIIDSWNLLKPNKQDSYVFCGSYNIALGLNM